MHCCFLGKGDKWGWILKRRNQKAEIRPYSWLPLRRKQNIWSNSTDICRTDMLLSLPQIGSFQIINIYVFPKEEHQYYCLFILFFLMLSFTRHIILWGIFFKSWLFFLLRKSWRSWCEILVKLIFEACAINKLKNCFVYNFSQLRQFTSVDVGRKISISSWLFLSTKKKKKKPSKIIMSQEIVKQKGKIYKKNIILWAALVQWHKTSP